VVEKRTIKNISNVVKKFSGKLNIQKFMATCENLFESDLLRTGGTLFENFIIETGSQKDAKLLKNFFMFKIDITEKDINRLIKKYTLQFWFSTLMNLRRMNQK